MHLVRRHTTPRVHPCSHAFSPAEHLPPWTSEIPPHLIHAAQLEEQYLARRGEPDAPPPPLIPHPPALPRHLEKVILNARTTGNAASASGVGKSTIASSGGVGAMNGAGTGTGAGVGGADDNSVLPVPNHVVLNHLGTSAIKGGVLAVGTTTRYHRKVRFSLRQILAPIQCLTRFLLISISRRSTTSLSHDPSPIGQPAP